MPALNKKLPVGPFTWTQFEEDGTERQRTGLVWAHGPMVGGRGALWVVPNDHEQKIVLVTQAPSRGCTYAGRVEEYRITRSASSWCTAPQGVELIWEPCGGRAIEPGEWYSETHDLSQTGSLTQSVNRTSQRA